MSTNRAQINNKQYYLKSNKPLEFCFNNKKYLAYEGDTLASALLANNVQLFGRSFKYHRKRSLLSVGFEEPNALVELGEGAYQEPNLAMTKIELYDGLIANSQNFKGSLKYDLMSVNQLFSQFLVGGFYYKTFMYPKFFWEKVYEPIIRKSAGLGSVSKLPDPDCYTHIHHHTEVLIVGGGIFGICCALILAQSGKKITFCEEKNNWGGSLLFQNSNTQINNQDCHSWLETQIKKLKSYKNVTLLNRTQVFGKYDHNVFGALQRVNEHLMDKPQELPRQKLWIIRTQKTILATGSIEKPCLFGNNDMPNIMLSSAFQAFHNHWGISFNSQVCIVTNNDYAYQVAQDLLNNKDTQVCVIDARKTLSLKAQELENQGVRIFKNSIAVEAQGFNTLKSLKIFNLKTQKYSQINTDFIAMSNGFSPNINLASQMGADVVFDDEQDNFIAQNFSEDYDCIGSCLSNETNVQVWNECIKSCQKLFPNLNWDIDDSRVMSISDSFFQELNLENNLQTVDATKHTKKPIFIDFQNDVTLKDIKIGLLEGMHSPEHLKRYTTLGMATDQGKTSNTNAFKEVARILNKQVNQIGTTKFRPPYSPVSIGAFAGEHTGKHFQPIRKTAIHTWHKEHNAVFVEAGQWLRPRYYKKNEHETLMQACVREAKQVRETVGICDVSTLGKIEVFGDDAANFLDKIYINNWQKLAINKVRYGLMLREDGMAMDDGTTARFAQNHFFMSTTTANAANVLAHLEFYAQTVYSEMDVHFCSATEQWASMAVAGPKSREVLQRVFQQVNLSNENLPFMSLLEFKISGVQIRIFRISFSGELAYEVNVPWHYAQSVWVSIYLAGLENNITPYGTEALSIMRIEKGHAAGGELDGRTTALDLGMEKMKSKTKDFVGKTLSLRKALNKNDRAQMVGVIPKNSENKIRGGSHLVSSARLKNKLSGNDSLGWISSVHFSPQFNCWIGIGFLKNPKEFSNENLVAYYPLKNETIPIKIVNPIFFDPKGERLHA